MFVKKEESSVINVWLDYWANTPMADGFGIA